MNNTIIIQGVKGLYNKKDLVSELWGQKILSRARKENLQVSCICNGKDSPLPLHVRKIRHSKTHHSYTLVRNNFTMDKHNIKCPNFGILADMVIDSDNIVQEKSNVDSVSKNTVSFSEADEENKGIEISNINNDIRLHFNTDRHIQTELGVSVRKDNDIYKREYKNYRKSTMYAIGETLLFYSWKLYIENNEHPNIPTIKNVFYNIYNNDIINYSIGKRYKDKVGDTTNLKSLIFKPFGAFSKQDISEVVAKAFTKIHIQHNKRFFMYVLGKIEKIEKYNEVFVKLKVLEPFKENYYYLLVNINTFKNHWNKKPTKADKYISCFLTNAGYEHLVVDSMAIIPVLKNRGVSVDSNNEVEFADALIDNNIYFIKPPKSFNPYSHLFKKYNPDFLLLEKKSREIVTIVEVFGYEKNNEYWEDYWLKANKKILFYNSLKNFNFFFWNAYEGKPIPPLYQPRKRIVE